MTKINSFTRSNLKGIRSDLEIALKQVGEKHGIKFDFRNIRFGSNEMSTRLTGTVESKVQEVKSTNFQLHCERFGLTLDNLGKEVVTKSGWPVKIVDINPRSKYPIVVMRVTTGKLYRVKASQVGGRDETMEDIENRREMAAEARIS